MIFTDVDYDAQGKQVDWLHLPHSVTRSAYGAIAIPIAVIRNGDGPTVFLMAGNHGDEYEGQITLAKLIRELEPEHIQRAHHHPAGGQPAGGHGRRAGLADRPGQPEPGLSRRPARHADLGHRPLHRQRAVPAGRLPPRPAFGRIVAEIRAVLLDAQERRSGAGRRLDGGAAGLRRAAEPGLGLQPRRPAGRRGGSAARPGVAGWRIRRWRRRQPRQPGDARERRAQLPAFRRRAGQHRRRQPSRRAARG